MQRNYHKWHCQGLGRDMELLAFGHSGARVLCFPTRCGRFYDFENMGMIETLRGHIERGWLQLFCVDSIDHETFYCNWCNPRDRILRHMEYERYIINEVMPLTRSLNGNQFSIVLGCSFGAYHAVNIAFRNPSLFARIVAFSGRYDLTRPVDGFRDLFDGYYDENIYFHTPSHYLTNLHCDHRLNAIRSLDIKIVIGENDPFLDDNKRLSEILWQRGIWHQFRTWNGRAHGYRRWREMVGWFL